MLATVHHDLTFQERCRAKPVGAAECFRPHRARTKACRTRRVIETAVGHEVEQHAVRRREGDHEVGAGNLLVQRVHLGQGQAADQRAFRLGAAQHRVADDLRRWRMPRVQSQRDAAHLAAVDIRNQIVGRRRTLLFKQGAGSVGAANESR